MANSLVALHAQAPDVTGAYSKGVDTAQGQQMNSLRIQNAQMELQNAPEDRRRKQAMELFGLIGSVGLGAMGGDLNGQVDPAKWSEGLDYLDKVIPGLGAGTYKDNPALAPIAAQAAITAAQRIQLAKSDRDYELAVARFQQTIEQAADTGLAVQYGRDANGNLVPLQATKDGRLVQSEMPEGVSLDLGVKSEEAAAGKERGSARGEAQVQLGGTLQKADQAISLIDQMLKHPGRGTATGLSSTLDPRNYIAGTDATNFNVMRKQLEGKAFLEAFESLKGGGQITEVEGNKATEAVARLSTAQSDEAYAEALNELRDILIKGKERAANKAAEPAGNATPAAPTGKQRLRYNPETDTFE